MSYEDPNITLIEIRERQVRELEQLMKMLLQYTRHPGMCLANHWPAGECDCGLANLVASVPAPIKTTENEQWTCRA